MWSGKLKRRTNVKASKVRPSLAIEAADRDRGAPYPNADDHALAVDVRSSSTGAHFAAAYTEAIEQHRRLPHPVFDAKGTVLGRARSQLLNDKT